MQAATLPYGDGALTFALPADWSVHTVEPSPPPTCPPLVEAARAAMAAPLGGPRLRERARPGMQVTIAITDATRSCPDHVLVPLLLEELEAAGVSRDDVTVVVALGMHRASTEAERRAKLGELAGTIRVEDAPGAETSQYRSLGTLEPGDTGGAERGFGATDTGAAGGATPGGEPRPAPLPAPVPIRLHRRVTECDLLVATGLVEPHQYAGFSGARKTVGIGCAGAETIGVLHGIDYLEHPGTRLGRLEGNPVHAALEAIARRAGLAFVLNVAKDGEGRPVAAAAGEPGAVLRALVERLGPSTWVTVGDEPYDAILAGVPAAKATNLYQGSRPLTYLTLGLESVLREGGWVVFAARCEEGAGQGPGEREFLARMREGADPADVLRRLRERGLSAGGQRAFMIARALERYRGLVVGAEDPSVVEDCLMTPAATPEEAVARLRRELPSRARALVIPNALAHLPVSDS